MSLSPLRRYLAVAFLSLAALSLAGCDTVQNFFTDSKKTRLTGKRISVLNLDHRLIPDPKLETTQITLPKPFVNPAWPDAGGYPNHAMYHLALGPDIKRLWKESIGAGASRYGRVVAQPVIADGRIYAMDGKDRVSAYDANTGNQIWKFDPQPKSDDNTAYGGGVAFGDGRLFVATGYGQVIALDAATGKEIWRVGTNVPIHGSPTVADQRVFVVTVDNQLQALSAVDGHRLWSHNGLPEPAELMGGASPAVSGDTVVVPYSSGEIFALRIENGRAVWTDNLAASQAVGTLASLADIRGAPVIDRDRVFALSHSGLMVAIDLRTGDRVWEQDIGGTHAPWVAGDFIYVLSNDSDLLCLSRADGHIRWVRELPRYENEKKKEGTVIWSGPVLAGNRLIVISSEGNAYSVSPYTGEPLGWTDFPDGVYVSPVVANNTLYVLTDDADLIAMR